LADIETHLDGIRLIPLTFRTASANNKVFAAAAALLASHRALEAELRDTIDAEEFNLAEFEAVRKERDALKAELAQAQKDVVFWGKHYEANSHATADAGDLGARLAAVEQRVAKLEGRGDDLDTWEWMAGNSDDSAEFFSERWELVATDANDPWVYIMRRPRQSSGEGE